jgi:dUTP pyrophosphatase
MNKRPVREATQNSFLKECEDIDCENPRFIELYDKHNLDNEIMPQQQQRMPTTPPQQPCKLLGKFSRATQASAGYDLYTLEDVTIGPGQMEIINTGVRIQSCPNNIYFKIHSRSGLFFRQRLEAFQGVIDADYTGEIKVMLTNHGQHSQTIKKGAAIAQFTVENYNTLSNDRVKLKSHKHTGFGSTD